MSAFLFSLGLVSVCLFMFGINLDLMWLRLMAKPLPILALIIWVSSQTKSAYRNRVLIKLNQNDTLPIAISCTQMDVTRHVKL